MDKQDWLRSLIGRGVAKEIVERNDAEKARELEQAYRTYCADEAKRVPDKRAVDTLWALIQISDTKGSYRDRLPRVLNNMSASCTLRGVKMKVIGRFEAVNSELSIGDVDRCLRETIERSGCWQAGIR